MIGTVMLARAREKVERPRSTHVGHEGAFVSRRTTKRASPKHAVAPPVRVRRGSRALESALASYVDPQVVSHLLSGGRVPLLSGVRRVVSCVFADIRGFTRFAATADPRRVVALLDHFFASACAIAIDHGGSIDKLVGDAVMVLFGVPKRRADSRQRALLAAITMVEAFDAATADVVGVARSKNTGLGLGAGVATGPVILANVGSSVRMDYTVVGATVNLAARLCAEARGGEVLSDLETVRPYRLRVDASVRSSTRVLRLKGLHGVVRARVFRVAGRHASPLTPETVDPVCGMKVAAVSGYERRYRNRVYRFCSQGCRARFDRKPAAFASMVRAP